RRPESPRLHHATQCERARSLGAFLRRKLLVFGPDLLGRRDEDGVAPLRERAEDEEHSRASGVAVGRGYSVVEDCDLRGPLSVGRALRFGRIIRLMLALQDLSPLLVELRVVDDLIALESGARVRACGRALVVYDARERLVYDLVAERADAHADVSVLVVCGCVATVEAAEALKQIFADEQRRAGAVVNLAREREAPVFRRAAPAVVERFAVRPHNRARLLNPPVRVEEQRADRARALVRFDCLDECFEPAGEDDRVVVEEDDVLAARGCRALIA